MKASESWSRLRAHRLAYTLMILITLAVGILIGTLVSINVKGKEGQKTASSDATPLQVPPVRQLSNSFGQIAKQLEPSVVTTIILLKISLIVSSDLAARAVKGLEAQYPLFRMAVACGNVLWVRE